MKTLLSIALIVILLLPSLSKLGIVIDFKIHQDYIAEALCIDKDKPQSSCEGNCYLKEQLENADEKDGKSFPNSIQEQLEIIFFFKIQSLSINAFMGQGEEQSSIWDRPQFYVSAYLSGLFRPPQIH